MMKKEIEKIEQKLKGSKSSPALEQSLKDKKKILEKKQIVKK
jgi:hypothetical protein|nr:MAG TPA: hypothetical protein [Caudoviricetes sp.]